MADVNGSSPEFDFMYYPSVQVQINTEYIIKTVVALSISMIFIYLNFIIFLVLRMKPTFRETSRYILFGQMLVNDSILLVSTLLLYLFILFNLKVTKAFCSPIVLVSTITFYNSPLILAVMSLERYIAICFPLQHADIVTPRRTSLAIAVVWFLSSLNIVTDLIFMAVTDRQFLKNPVYCSRENFFTVKWQVDVYQGFNGFFFVAVAMIIISAYTGIMVAARSVKAQKASRTVLLHLVQLGLCLTSFLYGSIQNALAVAYSAYFSHIRYLNFVIFLLLPRCLSPLIYGLRDESVRPVFLCYLRCGPSYELPPVAAAGACFA